MKQLQDNFTTIEQSKRLLELGVPADSADCYWQFRSDTLAEDWGYRCYIGTSPAIKDNLFSYRNGYTIPCWSVGRLIEVFETCTSTKFERWSHKGVFRPLLEDCIEHIKFALNPDTIIKLDFSKLEE